MNGISVSVDLLLISHDLVISGSTVSRPLRGRVRIGKRENERTPLLSGEDFILFTRSSHEPRYTKIDPTIFVLSIPKEGRLAGISPTKPSLSMRQIKKSVKTTDYNSIVYVIAKEGLSYQDNNKDLMT